VIDTLFETNGWDRSWRDTVYDFVHYHSQIHEVMGVARGTATLEFGGVKGRKVRLKAGDVAILPAGTGHRLIEARRGFLVIGAYPEDGAYDECTDTRDRIEAAKRIAKKRAADPAVARQDALNLRAQHRESAVEMRLRLNGPRRTSPIALWTPCFELLD
jgi:uncharacterized protein YjlB